MDPRFDPSIQHDSRSRLIPYHTSPYPSPSQDPSIQYDPRSRLIPPHTTLLPSPSQESFHKPQRPQVHYGKQRYYQPTITRLPSLFSLVALTLGLLAAIQYAIVKLPNYESNGLLSSIANKTASEAKDLLSVRDVRLMPRFANPDIEASPAAVIPSNNLRDVNTPVAPVTSVAAASNYVPTEEPTVELTAQASNYEGLGPESTPVPAPTAAPTAYIPINSKHGGTSAAPPTVYIPDIATSSAYQQLDDNPKPTLAAGSGGTKPVSNAGIGGAQPATADTSNYLSVDGVNPTLTAFTAGTPAPSNYLPGDTGVLSSATHSNYMPVDKTPVEGFTTTGATEGVTYAVITSAVVVNGHTFATAIPTTASLGDGKTLVIDSAGNAMIGSANIPIHRQQAIHSLTVRQYLIGAILPPVVAVLFIIPWLILDAAVKEMEPYYQLKRNNGASAADSLCMKYSSSITVVSAFKSMYKGHFTVLWSSFISLAVLLLPPLSSEAIYIGFIGRCTATSGREACIPRLSVYPLAARLLQGFLSFIAVLTLLLAIAIARRKSGVYASPLCIAGTASLMQNSKLLKVLRGLDPDTPNSRRLAKQLEGCRFRLGPYVDEDGQRSYGIKPSSSYEAPSRGSRTFGGEKYASVHVTSVGEEVHPKFRRAAWNSYFGKIPLAVLALVVAGMLTLIVYYNRTGGDTAFERFMDSQSFGTKFLFTAVGVGIKLYWSSLDDESQRLEPYRQLVHAPSPPSTLILLNHSSPFTGLYHSLRHSHFSTATISLLTILCDPLIVALANIPFGPGIPFITYRVSTYVSIGVLSLMLLAIVWMLFRAPMPRLVRQPDTLGSVMLFLCGSGMLGKFEGMAMMGRADRERMVRQWKGSYGFGMIPGVDGVNRWGIDEVPDRSGVYFA